MTADQFDAAYQAFARRRQFHAFRIEFNSGNQILICHPEAVRSENQLYVARAPDGGFLLFAADGVARLLD